MEPHTHALEVVCRHFKQEYGTEALLKLRRETNCLASQNYRLRKKNENMEIRIRHLLEQNQSIFITHRNCCANASCERIVSRIITLSVAVWIKCVQFGSD